MQRAQLTCETEGCAAIGKRIEMDVVENDDGNILGICGSCSSPIGEIVRIGDRWLWDSETGETRPLGEGE